VIPSVVHTFGTDRESKPDRLCRLPACHTVFVTMSRQQQRGGSEQLENYHLFESIGEGSFGRVRLWGTSLHGALLK